VAGTGKSSISLTLFVAGAHLGTQKFSPCAKGQQTPEVKESKAMLSSRFVLILVALAAVAVPAERAGATLIGDEVQCAMALATHFCDPSSATVADPGDEFDIIQDGIPNIRALRANFSASQLELIWDVNLPVNNEIQFSDLDWVGVSGVIVAVNLVGTSGPGTISGLTQANVNDVAAHGFDINLDGVTTDGGVIATFDIVTQHVPEPGTAALLALGFVGVGFAGRRRSA
jgi:hypothetical protein